MWGIGMSDTPDDLRTRIADCCGVTSVDLTDSDRYAVADAVIRELRLTIQVAGPDGIAYGKHRYVTDWIANE